MSSPLFCAQVNLGEVCDQVCIFEVTLFCAQVKLAEVCIQVFGFEVQFFWAQGILEKFEFRSVVFSVPFLGVSLVSPADLHDKDEHQYLSI